MTTSDPLPSDSSLAGALPAARDILSSAVREKIWLRRMLRSLAALTFLVCISALGAHGIGGLPGKALSLLADIALLAMAGAIWWQLRHMHRSAAEESLLREAFHSTLSPQLITDQHGDVMLANRAFQGWMDVGQRPALEVLASRLTPASDNGSDFRRLRESLYKGQSIMADMAVTRGTRITEWRRVIARPIDLSGQVYYWRFEDISERRRMEKAMRDEQNKLVDFMAHAPVGIYAVDQHGRFRFVNDTLAGWLQTTPDDLVKGDVRLHDVLGEAPVGVAPYAIAGGAQGELRGEVVMRRRDGQLFPVSITQTVAVGEDGKALRTRSIVRDLTPEREWQLALSLSEYRFQRLFAEAPIGVVLMNGDLAMVECNQAFLSMVRRPREALLHMPLADLVAPSARAGFAKTLRDVLSGHDLTKPMEVHLAVERDIVAVVYAKRFGGADANGGNADSGESNDSQKQGLMLYFIDATEQKRLEVQFAQSQKMQAIGQLAGGVAHDFNNLLTAMIGFCDLLLQRHKPGDQSFSDIMQIKQNGNRAANLVRQLLAFSRQQTLQPKVINLADTLSELTNLLRRLIGATVRLDMVHGRDLALVRVDQGQLEQVIINLVVNARDAMPSGGTVTIRTGNLHTTEPAMRGQDEMPPGRYVTVVVSDTGIGIPRANLQRIFEPFFSTKEVGSGTGLGLSTVYGIVRQTGGFVGVESQEGKGTNFTIYFPALSDDDAQKARDDAAAAAREEVTPPDLTGAGTVLLVEDEDAVRVFSARALRNKGYNVFEARSGEEALTVLEKEGAKIDLTVTDVVMPQMDGPTLYKHIRERWPSMKVVFVSGYTEDRLREQFSSGETIYFLGKPFTLKQLAGKVKEILSGGG